MPSGDAHSSLPEFASKATQTIPCCRAVRVPRYQRERFAARHGHRAETIRFIGTAHNFAGPFAGQSLLIRSALAPSWFGPRNCVQSAAWAAKQADTMPSAAVLKLSVFMAVSG